MLDLGHLSHQTLGNRALEREVLELFAAQIDAQVETLRTAQDGRQRKIAAHTIFGSSLAIGAFGVAQVAERIEAKEQANDGDVAELVDVVERTCTVIAARLESLREQTPSTCR